MTGKNETGKTRFHQQKGFGQDQVFLLAGMLILVITAYAIYTLIGGPYCDDLAKRTANNIKVAIDTVATPGTTYTKEYPYTTYAMLCQNKVGSPLVLNPVNYRAFSTPEYMIYWEHFPESPQNLAEGLYKFDESYPFTKHFAQIAAMNIGLSMFSGTLSFVKAVKRDVKTSEVARKVSQNSAFKVAEYFSRGVDKAGKLLFAPVTLPLKGINYLGALAESGLKTSIKFVFKVTHTQAGIDIVGKWITRSTAPNIFGRVAGLGFLVSMKDNYLIEFVELSGGAAAAAGDTFAVTMVRVGEVEKAVVPSIKREKLRLLVAGLEKSQIQEERNMGKNLKEYFAYTDEELAGEHVQVPFKQIVEEAETKDTGFHGLMSGAMDSARGSFDRNAKIMAKEYGLYPSRPITSFFEQTGITRFNKNVNALDVFRRMEFFDVDDAGKAVLKPGIAENMQKRFAGLKLDTDITDPDKMAGAVSGFFASDKAIIAGAETDTAIVSFLESQAKEGLQTDEKLYQGLLKGTASDRDVEQIAASLRTRYIDEIKGSGLEDLDGIAASASAKLQTPAYGEQLVNDFMKELEKAMKMPGVDTDEALEIAKFSTAWKREPEQLAMMAQANYEFMPYAAYDKLGGWSPKGTAKFMKTNIMSYAVSDVEGELKYSYLKSPNAGCESNTVCLNQKGVEQKKSDVAEGRVQDYETAYVVSKAVAVKLKRDGPTSPLGAGIGAFSFEKYPRFHLVSPCLAEIKFYGDGTDKETGKPLVMADVDTCPTPGHSNYCYFDEGKFNEAAKGFYAALACSVIADFGKLALVGFVAQPVCSSMEIWTEYDTTWPFGPFEPLKNTDMNIFQCNIEKNPKDAAKLAMRACCGIAQCTGGFTCSGINYADKNRLMCGADKCKLEDLAKSTGEDYKTVCGCQR